MAWDGSGRRDRLPDDWDRRRAATRERAGGRCEATDPATGRRCSTPGNQCDHIVNGDDHRLVNLQWLCADHHAIKSAREGVRARVAKYDRRRPTRGHPGLIG